MEQFKIWGRKLESRISRRSAVTQPFQFMSDLHLEVGQQYEIFDFAVTAPFLILAGDIGRLIDYDGYLAFLVRQISRYERVFLVLGNHEFYGIDYATGLERAQIMMHDQSLSGKVTLLQQSSYDFGPDLGIVLLGCVLWSHIPEESSRIIASTVNDFKQIKDWTISTHNDAHDGDVTWLQEQVKHFQCEQYLRTIIVVTHHAPLVAGTASPKYDNSPLGAAFATDICANGRWDGVRYWIFGHTHWTTSLTTTSGVSVVSNQRGYVFPGNTRLITEKLAPKHTFNASRTIQI